MSISASIYPEREREVSHGSEQGDYPQKGIKGSNAELLATVSDEGAGRGEDPQWRLRGFHIYDLGKHRDTLTKRPGLSLIH